MNYCVQMEAEAAASPEMEYLPDSEVLVSTTWECNLRCAYCFLKEKTFKSSHRQMSVSTARRLIDVLDDTMQHVESICVHLYGGEPLINLPVLREMVRRVGDKSPGRFSFAITTNGTLLSDEIIELLDRGNFQVILSIDGPAYIHDVCRRSVSSEPTHHRVIEFLEALKSRTRCWVRGSAVVRSGWRLKDADEYLRTLPVDVIKAQAVRVADSAPFALSVQEKQEYFSDLEHVGRKIIAELEAGTRPLDDRFSSRVLQILKGEARESFCGAGETTFGFLPDGTVTPCVLLSPEAHILGHIHDEQAKWISAGKQWKEDSCRRARCEGCNAFPLCGGGCPAIMPVCGANECDIIRKNCEVAHSIYRHFEDRPEMLVPLAGFA